MGHIVRKALTDCYDYNCAIKALSSEVFVAGAYFIVAGVNENEGAIITRDRSLVLDHTSLQ